MAAVKVLKVEKAGYRRVEMGNIGLVYKAIAYSTFQIPDGLVVFTNVPTFCAKSIDRFL